jgi:hypothetical protein
MQEPVGSGNVEVLPGPQEQGVLAESAVRVSTATLLVYLSHAPGVPTSKEVCSDLC